MAANIAAAQEVDQLIKKAMKLLHSINPTSAAELRIMLDDAIKQRHGSDKMLSNSLTMRLLEDEASFPGRLLTPPAPLTITTNANNEEIINLTHSPAKTISDSPDTIQDSDDGMSSAGINLINTSEADDGNLKDFGDLNCCICGEMMFTATNRLIECSKCSLLYHQECHKPPITDAVDDHDHSWQCDACSNKPSTSKTIAALVPLQIDEPATVVSATSSKAKSSAASSVSSSSSNSSSPFYKPDHSTSTTGTSSGSSSKHGHKSSSSSSSKPHKGQRRTTISGVPIPTINVLSAPDRHGNSTTLSTTKRSSSHSSGKSKSSSSKHHESSSSSRKGRSSK